MHDQTINFAMVQTKMSPLRNSILVVALAAALLGNVRATAEESVSACQSELAEATALTETIRVLWFPKSEYHFMSHTALEVDGQVWTKMSRVRKKHGFETYLRNANINTGFLSASIRVSPREMNDLTRDLEARVGGNLVEKASWSNMLKYQTCSSGVFELLVDHGMMKGPVLPAVLPLAMMSKLGLEKAYRNPRIAKIEWVGMKPRNPLPYLVGPSLETSIAYLNLHNFTSTVSSVPEALMIGAHDLYRLLMPLIH